MNQEKLRASVTKISATALGLALVVAPSAVATTWTETWGTSSDSWTIESDKAYGATWGTWALNSSGWSSNGTLTVQRWSTIANNSRTVYGQMRTYSSSGSCTTGISGGIEIKGIGASGGKTMNCTFEFGDYSAKSTAEYAISATKNKKTQTSGLKLKDGTNPRGNGVKAAFRVCIQRPWYEGPDRCSALATTKPYTLPAGN